MYSSKNWAVEGLGSCPRVQQWQFKSAGIHDLLTNTLTTDLLTCTLCCLWLLSLFFHLSFFYEMFKIWDIFLTNPERFCFWSSHYHTSPGHYHISTRDKCICIELMWKLHTVYINNRRQTNVYNLFLFFECHRILCKSYTKWLLPSSSAI